MQASVEEQRRFGRSSSSSTSRRLDGVKPHAMLRSRIVVLRPTILQPKCNATWLRRGKQTSAASAPSPPSPTPPPRRRRPGLSYIWYGLVLLAGSSLGFTVRNFAAPYPLPLPGTREDELALQALTADIEKLDIVKTMRAQGYHLHSDSPVSALGDGGHKGWVELDFQTNLTESKEDWGKKTRTLTAESMAGFKGLGVQRAFWNTETKELVAVVWIGGALSGWPGMAHGGAIATLCEDCMSRMVAGPNASIGAPLHLFYFVRCQFLTDVADSIEPPTSVSVTYAKPTMAANFYVLRASFTKPWLPQTAPPPDPDPAPAKSWLPSRKDFTKKAPPAEPRKTVEIIATLEDLNGMLCVRTKGTFPVPG